jgi:hypothetical protein
VLKQCIGQIKSPATDTFLTEPRLCHFNAAALQCPGNVDGPNCLTTDQVAAMDVYYEGSVNPSNSVVINPGNARGSETSSVNALGFALNESSNEPTFDSLFKWVFGLTWQWQTFDFNQNVAQVDYVLAGDLNATSTDLTSFNKRGGKLILYHGWADPLIPAIDTVDYFNDVTKTMFGSVSDQTMAQTQNFARLYMAPGVWHCGGSAGAGPGPSSFGGMIQQPAPTFDPQHDLLSALTQWVEKGTAPGSVIATKYNNDTPSLGIQMQRPLCVFPQTAQYDGTGDANLPTSFTCVPGKASIYNSAAATRDFDGDGRSDILWRHTGGNIAMWGINGATITANATLGAVPTTWSVAGQRDFNGDTHHDILWRNTNGNVAIWLMNGTKISSKSTIGNVPTAWSIAGTGDFNGDGNGDILWHHTSGSVAIWLMNGAKVSSTVPVGKAPTSWSIVGTGDFDGNGSTDILWRHTSGNLAVWLMNGGTVSSIVQLGNVPTAWSIVGTADFNGDGETDILWRHANGTVAIWTMDGGHVSSRASLANVPTAWSVSATGDYNGDGKSDILWTNSNGARAIWFMNGTTVANRANLANVPTAWAVQSLNAE